MNFSSADSEKLQPDKKLAVIVGEAPRLRSEIIRHLWDYINDRGLQDSDRRIINADKELQEVLGGKKQVNIFHVTTLLKKHLKPAGKQKKAAAKKGPASKKQPASKGPAAKKAAKKAPAKKTVAPKKAPKKSGAKTPAKKTSADKDAAKK